MTARTVTVGTTTYLFCDMPAGWLEDLATGQAASCRVARPPDTPSVSYLSKIPEDKQSLHSDGIPFAENIEKQVL